MPLTVGQTLSFYEILGPLGAGGMGEVYRARDTRLEREVAIKVLPEELMGDEERLLRFEREAKTLASLNHPNVVGIHGIDQVQDTCFIAMEFVPGEDLAERLSRGPLLVEEAIDVGRQIAEGLEAAHEAGIVHRDLKPANVRIMADGVVKVLDFGLARPMHDDLSTDSADAHSPTITADYTKPGVVLGTAAYMSPEQARGRVVDKRSDIWSFGVVLYEMLTGISPFVGETATDSIGAVLHKAVDLDRLPPGTPPSVKPVLARCLARQKRERYRDIGDVLLDLNSPGGAIHPSGAGTQRHSALRTFGVAALMALLGAVVVWFLRPSTPASPAPLVRFTIDVPGSGSASRPFLSSDGTAVAFEVEREVWVRHLNRPTPRKLELPWEALLFAWSQDSRSVIVIRRTEPVDEFWQVRVDSGESRMIGRLPEESGGWVWGMSPRGEDELAFGTGVGGIYTIHVRGGTARLIAPPQGEVVSGLCVLPGGEILAAKVNSGRIELLDGDRRKILLEMPGARITDPQYSPTGHILFRIKGGSSAPGIWVVPFSLVREEVTGAPFRFLPYGSVSVSANGFMAYRRARDRGSELRQLVVVGRSGSIEGTIGEPMMNLSAPSISPDGRRIAVSATEGELSQDIFIIERDAGTRYRLRDDVGWDGMPYWRDDGATIGFHTAAAGVRQARERRADGIGDARDVARAVWSRASRDGRYLLIDVPPALKSGDDAEGLLYLEERAAEPRVMLPGAGAWGDLSPNNRYLVYQQRDEPGIYLRRFPSGEGLKPVTTFDARALRWSPDGKELFLWSDDTLMVVSIDSSSDEPTIGVPKALFTGATDRLLGNAGFDLLGDGRLVMVRDLSDPEASSDTRSILITQNWAAEFEDR